jgi:hypothetical protein
MPWTAPRLRIVKGPNVKKLLSLAAFAAIVGAASLPAGAVTQTAPVTVKWNVSVTAALVLNQNYSATGAAQITAPTILPSLNGGTGNSCSANGVGSEAAATVNFGTITPDSGLTKNTDCLYKNAVDAQVTTNSSNWTLGEYVSSASIPAGATLCAYPNNFASFPVSIAAAGTAPATQSARASYTDNTTCAAAAATLSTTASSINLVSASAQAFTASPAHIGEDLALLLTPAAATGNQTVTVTYSLVAN